MRNQILLIEFSLKIKPLSELLEIFGIFEFQLTVGTVCLIQLYKFCRLMEWKWSLQDGGVFSISGQMTADGGSKKLQTDNWVVYNLKSNKISK